MRVPCILSTLRADGHPITSATWYGFVDDHVVVATPAERNKARNVRRDPRVSFIVDTKVMPYRGVAIEAIAELVPDPDHAILTAIVGRYLDPEATRQTLARLREQGERVIVRLRPLRVRTWALEPEPRVEER